MYGIKALGQFYLRHHNAIQTVGLLALLTVEVGVHIIIVIVVMTMAEPQNADHPQRHQSHAPDGAHGKAAAYGKCPIYRLYRFGSANFYHGLWQHGSFERLYHRNTVGGGLDAML